MASSMSSLFSTRPSSHLSLLGRPTFTGPVHIRNPSTRFSEQYRKNPPFPAPPTVHNSPRRVVTASLLNNTPLISPHDHWGMWTALFATGAFGIWSEKTKVGKALSGGMVSVLVGLAASSLGVISSEAPAYRVVLEYLLPIAFPLLLFNADLNWVLRSTGTLLLAFLLGSGD